jgi:hypothetical protein
MSYLTKKQLSSVCLRMRTFYIGLSAYYKAFAMDLESNKGRRNILMSEPMEQFLATRLKKEFMSVIADGRTGKADLLIKYIGGEERELECKLTSPNALGQVSFGTDLETLTKKGELDYIYIIASRDFSKFCAIHFVGLTKEDFRPLSPGSRGKVQMFKHKGMKKAKILLGNTVNLNDFMIEKIKEKQNLILKESEVKVDAWVKAAAILKETQNYKKKTLSSQIERANKKAIERINKLNNRINIIKERKASYSFRFESVEE